MRVEFIYRLIGSHVAHYRRQRRMTQACLGLKTQLSREAISKIECGRQRIHIHTLQDIALAIGVKKEHLMGEVG